ncbi:unnamed protein product [Acanthoscelides obtectus]|uniref:Lipase domain-containing protein n=1 Tax=Acanthoscelides obtectus TaxID=200917 RepID=A0A9P0PKL7_ACAOB|nr:unnamed protein product [Acanthoscelides obtectus]CAK1662212.1 Pancreatic lipase-related protein 2 [Acanthoscelides obtectus]
MICAFTQDHLLSVPVDLVVEEELPSESNITLKFFETGIRYHFFSQANPFRSRKLRIDTIESVPLDYFDANKETLFIIHGWKSHNESEISFHIRERILDRHDVNVFVVDWHIVAGKSYLNAQGNVRKVGQYIAKFITKLQDMYGLRLNKVKFVGHSLGAHIAGNAGAALNGEVDRITGLDPAGPLFSVKDTDNRLDPSDAKYVQVIHTNDGFLGFNGQLGHADYYPNGGKSQPGCGLDLAGICSHSRSYAYYAESLNSESFIAYQCDNYEEYLQGFCVYSHVSIMGMFNVDINARGKYYLRTYGNFPYARGWK